MSLADVRRRREESMKQQAGAELSAPKEAVVGEPTATALPEPTKTEPQSGGLEALREKRKRAAAGAKTLTSVQDSGLQPRNDENYFVRKAKVAGTGLKMVAKDTLGGVGHMFTAEPYTSEEASRLYTSHMINPNDPEFTMRARNSGRSPEQFAEMLQGIATTGKRLPEHKLLAEDALERFGNEMLAASRSDTLKINPKYLANGFFEDVIQIGPQVISQMGVALLTGGMSAGAFMGLQIYGSTTERLIAEGVPEDRARSAGLANALIQGGLEGVGLKPLTKFWKIRGPVAKKLQWLGLTLGSEWLTEFFQSFPDEAAALWAKDPDKGALKSLNEAISWATAAQGAKEGLVVLPWTLLGMGARKFARKQDYNRIQGSNLTDEQKKEALDQIAVPDLTTEEDIADVDEKELEQIIDQTRDVRKLLASGGYTDAKQIPSGWTEDMLRNLAAGLQVAPTGEQAEAGVAEGVFPFEGMNFDAVRKALEASGIEDVDALTDMEAANLYAKVLELGVFSGKESERGKEEGLPKGFEETEFWQTFNTLQQKQENEIPIKITDEMRKVPYKYLTRMAIWFPDGKNTVVLSPESMKGPWTPGSPDAFVNEAEGHYKAAEERAFKEFTFDPAQGVRGFWVESEKYKGFVPMQAITPKIQKSGIKREQKEEAKMEPLKAGEVSAEDQKALDKEAKKAAKDEKLVDQITPETKSMFEQLNKQGVIWSGIKEARMTMGPGEDKKELYNEGAKALWEYLLNEQRKGKKLEDIKSSWATQYVKTEIADWIKESRNVGTATKNQIKYAVREGLPLPTFQDTEVLKVKSAKGEDIQQAGSILDKFIWSDMQEEHEYRLKKLKQRGYLTEEEIKKGYEILGIDPGKKVTEVDREKEREAARVWEKAYKDKLQDKFKKYVESHESDLIKVGGKYIIGRDPETNKPKIISTHKIYSAAAIDKFLDTLDPIKVAEMSNEDVIKEFERAQYKMAANAPGSRVLGDIQRPTKKRTIRTEIIFNRKTGNPFKTKDYAEDIRDEWAEENPTRTYSVLKTPQGEYVIVEDIEVDADPRILPPDYDPGPRPSAFAGPKMPEILRKADVTQGLNVLPKEDIVQTKKSRTEGVEPRAESASKYVEKENPITGEMYLKLEAGGKGVGRFPYPQGKVVMKGNKKYIAIGDMLFPAATIDKAMAKKVPKGKFPKVLKRAVAKKQKGEPLNKQEKIVFNKYLKDLRRTVIEEQKEETKVERRERIKEWKDIRKKIKPTGASPLGMLKARIKSWTNDKAYFRNWLEEGDLGGPGVQIRVRKTDADIIVPGDPMDTTKKDVLKRIDDHLAQFASAPKGPNKRQTKVESSRAFLKRHDMYTKGMTSEEVLDLAAKVAEQGIVTEEGEKVTPKEIAIQEGIWTSSDEDKRTKLEKAKKKQGIELPDEFKRIEFLDSGGDINLDDPVIKKWVDGFTDTVTDGALNEVWAALIHADKVNVYLVNNYKDIEKIEPLNEQQLLGMAKVREMLQGVAGAVTHTDHMNKRSYIYFPLETLAQPYTWPVDMVTNHEGLHALVGGLETQLNYRERRKFKREMSEIADSISPLEWNRYLRGIEDPMEAEMFKAARNQATQESNENRGEELLAHLITQPHVWNFLKTQKSIGKGRGGKYGVLYDVMNKLLKWFKSKFSEIENTKVDDLLSVMDEWTSFTLAKSKKPGLSKDEFSAIEDINDVYGRLESGFVDQRTNEWLTHQEAGDIIGASGAKIDSEKLPQLREYGLVLAAVRDPKTGTIWQAPTHGEATMQMVDEFKSVIKLPDMFKGAEEKVEEVTESEIIKEVKDQGKSFQAGLEQGAKYFDETMQFNWEAPPLEDNSALERQKQRDRRITKLLGTMSVEAPWRRKGMPNIGRAFKGFFGFRTSVQEKTANVIKEFMRMAGQAYGKALPESFQRDVLFLAEDPEYIDEIKGERNKEIAANIAGALNDWFAEHEQWYKDHGIEFNFKQRMSERIIEKMKNLEQGSEEMQLMIDQLEFVDRMNFVHIPIAVLYDKTIAEMTNKDKPGLKKNAVERLKMLNAMKRQQLSLRALWEQMEKKKAEGKSLGQWTGKMSIPTVMLNYGYRLSKDKARIQIKKALENPGEGKKPLIIPFKGKKGKNNKQPKGWIKLKSFKKYGVLSDHYMDPDAYAMWEQIRIVDEKQNMWDKTAAVTKLWQFANPFFLGIYDIYQHFMSGTPFIGALTHPIRTVTNIGRAFKAVHLHNELKQEAAENNAYSKPYDYPFMDIVHQMERYMHITGDWKKSMMVPWTGIKQAFKQTGRGTGRNVVPFLEKEIWNPVNILLAAYKATWYTAWKFDELVRTYTYLQLKDQGLNEQQAGEITAAFHADYASVPAKTRRMANRAFFTPTFKIAMAKLYANMIKSAWTVPRDFITPGKKVDPIQLRYFMGIIGTVATNAAYDAIMRGLGYEPDDEEGFEIFNFGRKYIKKDRDRFGPSEITFTWSNPGNLPQRYLQRIAKAYKGDDPFIKKAFDVIKWDLHPILNTVGSMVSNITPEGDQIWSDFDPPLEQNIHKISFLVANMIKLTELGTEDMLNMMPDSFRPELPSKGKVRANAYKNENFKWYNKWLIAKGVGMMNLRVRTPRDQRIAWELGDLIKRYSREQRRHGMLTGADRARTLKQLKVLQKKIKKLEQELIKERKKK
jgi:hypothetical protein